MFGTDVRNRHKRLIIKLTGEVNVRPLRITRSNLHLLLITSPEGWAPEGWGPRGVGPQRGVAPRGGAPGGWDIKNNKVLLFPYIQGSLINKDLLFQGGAIN